MKKKKKISERSDRKVLPVPTPQHLVHDLKKPAILYGLSIIYVLTSIILVWIIHFFLIIVVGVIQFSYLSDFQDGLNKKKIGCLYQILFQTWKE